MQEGLTIQGDLRDLSIPEILRNLIRNEGVSSVRLTKEEHTCTLYVKNGDIVFADSDDPDRMLGTILFVRGEIGLDDFMKIRDGRESGKSDLGMLVELDILAPDDMLHAVDLLVKQMVMGTISWTTGSYVMVFDDSLPEGAIPARIHTDEVLLNAVRSIDRWSLVYRGLGGQRKTYRRTPNMDSRFYELDLSEDESHLYSLLDSPRTTQEILRMSYLKPFVSMRSLWALKCVNLIDEIMVPEPDGQTSEADEFIWSSMVESYNNAFAALFHALQKDIGDEVFDFIRGLEEELDPSIKGRLEGMDFHNEGRIDYDLLYNSLVASGVNSIPQALQDILNEILYGWVFRIRKVYGDQYNPILDSVINSIREE